MTFEDDVAHGLRMRRVPPAERRRRVAEPRMMRRPVRIFQDIECDSDPPGAAVSTGLVALTVAPVPVVDRVVGFSCMF